MPSKEEINNIAKLARLGIKENEKFQKEISSILDYFEILKNANTSKIEPVFHSSEKFINQKTIMRKDQPKESSKEVVDDILNSAPDKKERYIKVKQIL